MISYQTLCKYLLAKPGASEDYPFGPEPLVAKVGGKMFALASNDATHVQLSLKCDPDRAEALRSEYPAIQPGYHLSKRHWNTVTLDGSIADEIIWGFIDDSYHLVVNGLSRAVRQQLAQESGDRA